MCACESFDFHVRDWRWRRVGGATAALIPTYGRRSSGLFIPELDARRLIAADLDVQRCTSRINIQTRRTVSMANLIIGWYSEPKDARGPPFCLPGIASHGMLCRSARCVRRLRPVKEPILPPGLDRAQRMTAAPHHVWGRRFLIRQGLLRPDVVVAGEQIAGVVLTLDRHEPLIGLRWIDRGDILLGGRSEEISVGAVDVRCESPPDLFQGRTSGLDDRLRPAAVVTNINSAWRCA